MRTPTYPREYKRFGLHPARQARVDRRLSNVVLLADERGKGFTYIAFAEEFVEAVGKAMPQGVGEETPCYIKVVLGYGGVWRIYGQYLDNSATRLLWETTEKPSWIKQVRRPK